MGSLVANFGAGYSFSFLPFSPSLNLTGFREECRCSLFITAKSDSSTPVRLQLMATSLVHAVLPCRGERSHGFRAAQWRRAQTSEVTLCVWGGFFDFLSQGTHQKGEDFPLTQINHAYTI